MTNPFDNMSLWFNNSRNGADTQSSVNFDSLASMICLSTLPLLTIFGNGLVGFAILTKSYLRTPAGFLILSLATSDLIVGACVMPLQIALQVSFSTQWQLGHAFCYIWDGFGILARTASIWNLCAISLDRFVAIWKPLGYRDIVSLRKVLVAIGTIWLCSIIVSFPMIAWWSAASTEWQYVNKPTTPCIFTKDATHLIFSSVISFCLPTIVILFTYSQVYIIASRHGKSVHGGRKKLSRRSSTPKAPSLYIRIHKGGANMGKTTPSAKLSTEPQETSHLLQRSPASSKQSSTRSAQSPKQKLSGSSNIMNSPPYSARSTPNRRSSQNPNERNSRRMSHFLGNSPENSPFRTPSTRSWQSPSTHSTHGSQTPKQKLSSSSNVMNKELLCHEGNEIEVVESCFTQNNQNPLSKTCPTLIHSVDSIDDPECPKLNKKRKMRWKTLDDESITGSCSSLGRQNKDHDEFSIKSFPGASKLLRSITQRHFTIGAESLQSRLREFFYDTLPSTISAGHRGKQQKLNVFLKFMREKRAAKTIGIVVGCFLTCWLPFFIINIIFAAYPRAIGDPYLVYSVVAWLGHCNSMLNPLIYGVSNREFRRAFKQILCRKQQRYSTQKGMGGAIESLLRVLMVQFGHQAELDRVIQNKRSS